MPCNQIRDTYVFDHRQVHRTGATGGSQSIGRVLQTYSYSYRVTGEEWTRRSNKIHAARLAACSLVVYCLNFAEDYWGSYWGDLFKPPVY